MPLHVHCAAVQPQPGAALGIVRRRRLSQHNEVKKNLLLL